MKIDDAPFDSQPGNEPHVTCAFQDDFYNYGAGDYWAEVQFALNTPTRSGLSMTTTGSEAPWIGEDPPGGGTDVDAQKTYQLAFTGSPHPKQGYHVKLTIYAPHSQGADTKHKVFWVRPCSSGEQPPGGGNGKNPPGGGAENPPGGGVENPPGGGAENPPGGGGGETPPAETPPGGNGQPSLPGLPGVTSPIPAVPGNGSGSPVTTPSAGTTTGPQGAPSATTQSSAAQSVSAAAESQASRSQAAQVPTTVEAGLTGGTPTERSGSWATSLLGLTGLLVAAGWLAAYRRRGARRS